VSIISPGVSWKGETSSASYPLRITALTEIGYFMVSFLFLSFALFFSRLLLFAINEKDERKGGKKRK